jgi:2-haloalkanoic acid dehalogenase type II
MMEPQTKAVFFDFGGTLYDYTCLEQAEIDSLADLARWAGIDADPLEVWETHKEAMRRIFPRYRSRTFYHHHDLFRDALTHMLDALNAEAEAEHLDRYRELQWKRHARDFRLRQGVRETLTALRNDGLHLGLVSNIDEDQLQHLLGVAKIEPYFHSILSSEQALSCKPHPGIFRKALHHAGCRPEEALFVGDSILQDIAGANEAGLRSVLLWHRDDRDPPQVDSPPSHVIREVPELLALL